MSDNLYIAYWQSLLPSIIKEFNEGKSILQLNIEGIEQFRDRQTYYSNLGIINCKLELPKAAHASGRDLYDVVMQDIYSKEVLASATIQLTITKKPATQNGNIGHKCSRLFYGGRL